MCGDITLANVICKSLWKTQIELQFKCCRDCWLSKKKETDRNQWFSKSEFEWTRWFKWFKGAHLFVQSSNLRFFNDRSQLQTSNRRYLHRFYQFAVPSNQYSLDCHEIFASPLVTNLNKTTINLMSNSFKVRFLPN